MEHRRVERNIVLVLVAILLAAQLTTLLLLHESNYSAAVDNMDGLLRAGARVSISLLEARQRELDETASVLGADFGLREAIATGDRATTDSMIENHARRAEGMVIALYDLKGQLITKSPGLKVKDRLSLSVPVRLEVAGKAHPIHVSTLDTDESQIFQLALQSVRAPAAIATIVVAFPIDDPFADKFAELTGMQTSFFSRGAAHKWRLHGGDLPDPLIAQLLERPGLSQEMANPATRWILKSEGETFLATPLTIHRTGTNDVTAVLGRSLDYAMQPLRKVEHTVLTLLVGSLALAVVGIMWVTRRLVAPINESANVDPLTGLANRRSFEVAIERVVREAQQRGKRVAVLMMDLNKFKAINDTLGHAAGDEVLKTVATRLRNIFRTSDTLARLGGDEFAILLPGLDERLSSVVLDNLVSQVSAPFLVAGKEVAVGASIGVAILPDDGTAAAALLEKADQAMYAAKASGGGYVFVSRGSLNTAGLQEP